MELVDAINARFVETAMKELMHDDIVSIKKEKTNAKTNGDKVMRMTSLAHAYPEEFMSLSTLPTKRGNSLLWFASAKAVNIETATERFPLG
jgi:hypothetical protein